jgi:uncharacterized membrane protein YozB (DUF420 family)
LSYQSLPILNATLNAISTVLLVLAYIAIKRRRVRTHMYLMLAALVTSALFLTFYLIYHAKVGEKSTAQMTYLPPWLRTLYLGILFPHILLAAVMVPMILMSLWRAYRRQWTRHRRIATPTFWIWLYVSVTGVIIYWMLYHLFPSLRTTT